MPFDPTKPADDTQAMAAQLRDQFNALKAINDAQALRITALETQVTALQTALAARPTMDDVNAAINTNAAANPTDITYLQLQVSDPPMQSDVQAVLDLQNSLITALKRQS